MDSNKFEYDLNRILDAVDGDLDAAYAVASGVPGRYSNDEGKEIDVSFEDRLKHALKRYEYFAGRLDEHHERYKTGDKTALIDALMTCFAAVGVKIAPPEWVRFGFGQAHTRYEYYVPDDPNDPKSKSTFGGAFGMVRPKGKHEGKERRRIMLARYVYLYIQEESKKGISIDDKLFKKAAEEINSNTIPINVYEKIYKVKQGAALSSATAKTMYYEQQKKEEALQEEIEKQRLEDIRKSIKQKRIPEK